LVYFQLNNDNTRAGAGTNLDLYLAKLAPTGMRGKIEDLQIILLF